MNLKPKEIVAYLDDFIIGQNEAKRAIAIALRNRWRRLKLEGSMRDEVMPKNILMIGATGVGKTEIARRMAKLLKLPFIKVEATKYTEVGFVGRDVESMVRDLVLNAMKLARDEVLGEIASDLDSYIVEKIANELIPPLPNGSPEAKVQERKVAYEKMKQKVIDGAVDHLMITIEISPKVDVEVAGLDNLPPEMSHIQESLSKVFGQMNRSIKKEVSVKDAKELLKDEASQKLLDKEKIRQMALKKAEEGGIIFIDELDKIAVASTHTRGGDPSKEGVQRDLLPIVEGSSVNTKYGQIKTDHILFIGAGAFHTAKPSDLIAELQGRFPIRVEMKALDEEALYKILTTPKNSLTKQYVALMATEGVDLIFEDSALKEMARLAKVVNDKTEDIGARRLHTVMEKILEDISFSADEFAGKEVVVDDELVHKKLDMVFDDNDAARYIL